jgi:hypothetical protein
VKSYVEVGLGEEESVYSGRELRNKLHELGMYFRDWLGQKARQGGVLPEERRDVDSLIAEMENGFTCIEYSGGTDLLDAAQGCYDEALRIAKRLGVKGVRP